MKKEVLVNIYKMLDEVSPIDYDCGRLCGAVCCKGDDERYNSEDLAIYLLPGEEELFVEDENFELDFIDAKEIRYPYSWKDKIYLLKCLNPPECNRTLRPIQCRSYPLIAHISKKGKLHLIFDESEYPYRCPLIRDNIKLNEDFIKKTFKAWEILITDPLIYDLIEMDSIKRDNKKIDYKIII